MAWKSSVNGASGCPTRPSAQCTMHASLPTNEAAAASASGGLSLPPYGMKLTSAEVPSRSTSPAIVAPHLTQDSRAGNNRELGRPDVAQRVDDVTDDRAIGDSLRPRGILRACVQIALPTGPPRLPYEAWTSNAASGSLLTIFILYSDFLRRELCESSALRCPAERRLQRPADLLDRDHAAQHAFAVDRHQRARAAPATPTTGPR